MTRELYFIRGFIILLFIIPVLSSGQEKDLSSKEFLTGYFIYKEKEFADVLVKRTKSRQIETIISTGIIIKYKIEWDNDIEYYLIQEWTNNKEWILDKNSKVSVIITEIHAKSYIYKADYEGSISTGTMIKISKKEAKNMLN